VTYEELGELEPFDAVLDQVGGELFAAALEPAAAARDDRRHRFRGRSLAAGRPALLVGANVSVAGFYLGRLMKLRRSSSARRRGAARAVGAGAVAPVVGRRSARGGRRGPPLVAERRSTGKVVLVP
jgi:NADPH:quinone reductase-like Zn-dependent oxidoreductase